MRNIFSRFVSTLSWQGWTGIGAIVGIIALVIVILSWQPVSSWLAHLNPSATATSTSIITPSVTSSLAATATSTSIATPSATPILISVSSPTKTLQTLCNATTAEDYPTQWDQFSSTFRTETWTNEQTFISGVQSRDNQHGGVAKCTFTNVMQNGSSASSTTTTTFNDNTTDIITFTLTKEGDGIWRINSLTHLN